MFVRKTTPAGAFTTAWLLHKRHGTPPVHSALGSPRATCRDRRSEPGFPPASAMRLVVCLVFLASFALVCQGQVYKGGYTRRYPGHHPSLPCLMPGNFLLTSAFLLLPVRALLSRGKGIFRLMENTMKTSLDNLLIDTCM
ncbi:Penaeidin-3g [Penaeus vannamei]|uniref:Penaeidin-3g n=1 Tax=Penaeus vannamei TaxID=6689 RepID=A0A3R7M729_PENVA|nr:Penaeidin-3g [Penaeus vannamei]